ncbi:MAG: acyl-CoA dehydrogenase family protein [bacterium]
MTAARSSESTESSDSAQLDSIRQAVRALCAKFDDQYWMRLDAAREYPAEFVAALTASGYLAALIPQDYGGSGLGLREACAVLEEISRCGGHPGACHAQMYVMGSLLRHGSEAQKRRYLPAIASGELRLQSFAVTEPDSGTDTASLRTFARKRGDVYRVSGQKVWTSRVEHSDLMLLLARTTPQSQTRKRTDGLSVFIVDLARARDNDDGGLTVRPIDAMINHHACELFFDDLEIPAENRLGAEGDGFRIILDSMNAERILIAAECIGDGKFFIDRASAYARQREVFGRPIGQNQGVQFPIARCHVALCAAELMVIRAARLFDSRSECGAEANMAKMLASEASWSAADMCMEVHGGYAFAREYHIERKFRETRLYRTAPISTNFILSYIAEHVLDLPRSY